MYKKKSNRYTVNNWQRVWIEEYRHFLKLKPGDAFPVDEKSLIAFLADLRKRGKKAWQRLQAAKSICSSAHEHFQADVSQVQHILDKLEQMAHEEQAEEHEEEVRMPIPPFEHEIVKRLRKRIRYKHHAWNTEKAYVGYVQSFIERFELNVGLRIDDYLRLRVKDIGFDQNQIVFRESKGNGQRTTMLTPRCPYDTRIARA